MHAPLPPPRPTYTHTHTNTHTHTHTQTHVHTRGWHIHPVERENYRAELKISCGAINAPHDIF